jgi:hypothetical protein
METIIIQPAWHSLNMNEEISILQNGLTIYLRKETCKKYLCKSSSDNYLSIVIDRNAWDILEKEQPYLVKIGDRKITFWKGWSKVES